MADSRKTAVLIDANSLIHRAYHALPPFHTRKGEMVNAVFGFVSILLRVMKELEPTYIAAAFDMEGPTFRHKKFAEYKGTREKAPDELYQQFPFIKEVLAAFHIPIYEKQGFEADDIIGTLAKKISEQKESVETIIVSGDMDTLQLVDEHTKVYTMRKSIQDSQIYDSKAVEEKFEGLKPSQVIDYKGLRGDPSDNIPGVPGVGEKTAIQLLGEFGSIENMYKKLKKKNTEVKPKLQEKLLQEEEKAVMSKELATIERDVPIPFLLEDSAWRSYDQGEVEALLHRFEFDSLIKRMPGQKEAGKQKSMFEEKQPEEDTAERVKSYEKDGVFSKEIAELETKLTSILRDMEDAGIKIDKPYFKKLGSEMEKEIKKIEEKVYKRASKEFNISSTQQLSAVLFEDLGISPKGLKKTPKGVISTASPELEKIQKENPIVEEVLTYRELKKIYTTYVKPLPVAADENSRVHTHFDQFGAATGRMSSSNPNLQNIPKQGEWGKKIRKGFIAEKGFQLVSFDYSQIELRIAAHVSGDKKMKEFFEAGADIHQMTAAEVFAIDKSEVTEQMRFRAKALNFGVLYGMGARGFASSAGISIGEAEDFIENYFVRFPQIHEYMEGMKEFAREHGYVETMFGRKRYIPEIDSTTPQLRAAAERMAINHPIQGSAADIMKMAMVRVEEDIELAREKWKVLLQIHDELLCEITDGILEEIGKHIKASMEKACTIDVPIVVEVKAGLDWSNMKKLHL